MYDCACVYSCLCIDCHFIIISCKYTCTCTTAWGYTCIHVHVRIQCIITCTCTSTFMLSQFVFNARACTCMCASTYMYTHSHMYRHTCTVHVYMCVFHRWLRVTLRYLARVNSCQLSMPSWLRRERVWNMKNARRVSERSLRPLHESLKCIVHSRACAIVRKLQWSI